MADANQVVIQLIGDTANLDQKVGQASQSFSRAMQTIESSAVKAEGSVRQSHNGIAESSGNANAAQLILQSTVRRTTDQFAAGAPIATIFAEHISALAEASSLAGSSFGKFGELMEGPWGIAITSAISIAALLAQKLYEGSDAAATDAKAHDALTDAVNRLSGASAILNHETQQGIVDSINDANAKRQQEIATRGLLSAKLASAKADLVENNKPQVGGGGVTIGNPTAIAAAGTVDDINKQLSDNAAQLQKANSAIIIGAGKLVRLNAEAATSQKAAIEQTFDRASDRLQRQFEAGKIDTKGYQSQLVAITRTRDTGLSAAQKQGRGGGAGTGDADAQARLATATNAVQRAEAQLAITRRDGAAAVKAGKLSQAEYEQQLESGMQKVNDAKSAVDAHKESVRDQAKATRDAAAAQRELDTALSSIIRKFDPARAAAQDYADTLETIARLVQSGRLTQTQGIVYSYKAALDYQDDQKKNGPDAQATKNLDSAVPDISTLLKNRGDEQDGEFKAQMQNQAKLKAQQDKDVESLANTFDRLFQGGTQNIWKTFKEEGEKEIAYLLAKLVVLQATQGGSVLGNIKSVLSGAGTAGGKGTGGLGGIIGGISKIFGGGVNPASLSSAPLGLAGPSISGFSVDPSLLALPGLASGGYAAPGSVHRVNESGGGVELLRMGPQGGTVIPLGQTKAASSQGGGGNTYHISVSADNSVTPAGFAQGLASEILSRAAEMDAQTGRSVLAAAPGQVNYTQSSRGS